jgi:adenylosuccinate lyase
MLALVDKGISREEAYALVQRNAMKAWDTRLPFKSLILEDREIMNVLKEKEVEELFDYAYHTKNIDYIFQRIGLI